MNSIWKKYSSFEKVFLKHICEINPPKKEINGIDLKSLVSYGMMDELLERKPFFKPRSTKMLSDALQGSYSYFKENDILLAKMTPCFENGKSGIAVNLKNGIGFGSTEFYVLRPNGKVLPYWIYSIISSNYFLKKGRYSLVGTTGRRRLMKQFVENFQIPLPPLEEQKRIAALFQSIDAAIEQTEAQEKNLRNLITKLSEKLVNKDPEFGNLIVADHLVFHQLGSISCEKRETSKNPLAEGFERFVGLEHIEPGNMKITNWGNVADGTTFTKTFKPGDVLFGRRRAYLKKVGVADFKGLCSGDIIVIKPDRDKILPELFPFYISANAVFDHAVSTSAGSLSPRTKWKDLSKFEFSLPPLDVQEKILDVFQSIQNNIDLIQKQHIDLKNLKQNLLNEILG